MSYEHCHKHDEEATNGCESCHRESVMERAKILDNVLDGHVAQEVLSIGEELKRRHAESREKRENLFAAKARTTDLGRRESTLGLLRVLRLAGFRVVDETDGDVDMTEELLRIDAERPLDSKV